MCVCVRVCVSAGASAGAGSGPDDRALREHHEGKHTHTRRALGARPGGEGGHATQTRVRRRPPLRFMDVPVFQGVHQLRGRAEHQDGRGPGHSPVSGPKLCVCLSVCLCVHGTESNWFNSLLGMNACPPPPPSKSELFGGAAGRRGGSMKVAVAFVRC